MINSECRGYHKVCLNHFDFAHCKSAFKYAFLGPSCLTLTFVTWVLNTYKHFGKFAPRRQYVVSSIHLILLSEVFQFHFNLCVLNICVQIIWMAFVFEIVVKNTNRILRMSIFLWVWLNVEKFHAYSFPLMRLSDKNNSSSNMNTLISIWLNGEIFMLDYNIILPFLVITCEAQYPVR